MYIRLQSLPSFEIQTKFRGSLSRNEQLDKTEIENERFPILKEEGTISEELQTAVSRALDWIITRAPEASLQKKNE